MVPTQNLVQNRPDLFSTIHNKNTLTMTNNGEIYREDRKTKEEIKEETNHTNPKDWLQLGFGNSTYDIKNGGPIELELFTRRPPYQQQRQITSSSKRPRHVLVDHVEVNFLKSSRCLVNGGDIRVVAPPRRPEVGVWLILCAAQNQMKEQFLPQIEKSYLRFKEGNMTVRVLMKYLANRIGLGNEFEVEMFCKGQSLPPFMMLQYVRDHIWRPRDGEQLSAPLTATDQLMILHYCRSR